MKPNWTGDEQTDLILTLLDDSGGAILGQVIRDNSKKGWNGHDYYSNGGTGKFLGFFKTADKAREAVVTAVSEARGQTGAA
jgi:hypothetical protein